MQRLHSIVGILLFTAVTQAALAQGNEKRKTVLDGVFTAAQAERGKEAYATHCSTCHMEDLGGLSAPALKGEQFIDNWREDSVRSLFTFIRTQMPQRAAGSLEEKMYVDILAHILSVNMFPSGSNELSADALGSIDLVGKDGPAPIPKFALIALVGCLARADGEEWKLDNASAPARTRQEKPAAGEAKASAGKPLGTGTFRLVYIDSLRPGFLPESHVGHKLHLPIIAIDNQHLLTDTEITYPREYRKEAVATKLVTRLMTPGADAYLVISFFQARVKKKKTFLFPPILREEVLRATPTSGDFVLVYVTSAATELTDVLKSVRQRFLCYGFNREGKDGNVEFRKPGLDTFLGDLSTCRAVIANAGFSLISEALYLAKPYLAWPVKRQFEQIFNAYYIGKTGYGAYWDDLKKERVESFLYNLDVYRTNLATYQRQDNSALFAKLKTLIASNAK